MQSYLRPLYIYAASERLIAGRIGARPSAQLAEAVQTLKSQIDPPPVTP